MMRTAVESGAIHMPQEGFKNTYFHWIDNLRDWCISRQIWFGHRIPVWYDGEQIRISDTKPEGDEWTQDEDVLDTWFSSQLWTFSTLGWPEETNDLRQFHPTAFMCPGYEIISLWVSRMILASGFLLGEVPFKTVLIHGLVRDSQGRKFSKSLGNGVDPIEVIEKYGADALRMGLLVGTAIGNDIRFDENKIRGYKNFANKLWNITRFVLENTPQEMSDDTPILTGEDEEDIRELRELIETVTTHFETYRMDLAADALYHYVWHTFADVVVEKSKEALKGDDANARARTVWKLQYILETVLTLLHPFMPFVTEEIWQNMDRRDSALLMVRPWPTQ
jgi:valyl-tRNA synthetase